MTFPRLRIIALFWLTACGCSSSDIDAVYGRRRGANGGASVNGVGVLAAMFEAAGHKVITKRHLCPKFQDCQTVVWAPDDFAPPSDEQVQFFEDWLRTGDGRTLIYVGRDYDASIAYWDQVQPSAPSAQAVEVLRRLSNARAKHSQAKTAMPAEQSCPWFRIVRNRPLRRIGMGAEGPAALEGVWCDHADIDAGQVNLEIDARFEAPSAAAATQNTSQPDDAAILLAAGPDVFVRRLTRPEWRKGQVIVVTNGAFLLNLPLVQKEHRKLAAQLIAECAPAASAVVFLESEQGGPPLLQKEPGEDRQSGFEPFTVWPIGAILLHFVAVGLLYLLSRMPIFGRPQELAADSVSDFGKHVHALGELLARTQESAYAQRRLSQYQEHVKRESGATAGNLAKRTRPPG